METLATGRKKERVPNLIELKHLCSRMKILIQSIRTLKLRKDNFCCSVENDSQRCNKSPKQEEPN